MTQKQALNQIMQVCGHIVVLLSSDRYRGDAERQYLQQYCAAKTFDGMIDCIERYENLSQFERIFLSELSISRSYEVEKFSLIPGKLSEGIPVFLKEHGGFRPPDIFVDVRHKEISKLESLGYIQIFILWSRHSVGNTSDRRWKSGAHDSLVMGLLILSF